MTGLFETLSQRILALRFLLLLLGFALVATSAACFLQGAPEAPEAQASASPQTQIGQSEIPVQGSLTFPNTDS